MHCHCIISKIVSNVKFFINQLSHIWIKAIYQRITMVFPAIVLNTENRTNANNVAKYSSMSTALLCGEITGIQLESTAFPVRPSSQLHLQYNLMFSISILQYAKLLELSEFKNQ